MRLARVVGQVVATVKEPELNGFKLLLVHDLDYLEPANGATVQRMPYVAVDLAGAGEGEVVVVTTGSAARVGARTAGTPVDLAVVGIVDTVVVEGRPRFDKTRDMR
ncbi:MAG TPA: EutN/CcmL family microcompartment protein [Candidatus Dormibacteraeota bacterium]